MNAKFMGVGKFMGIGVIAFVAALTAPVAAIAQSSSPADSSALVRQLEQQGRMDEFKAKFWSQEPITQQDYYVQEKEDRQLIAKISAGEPVSHAELKQALQRVDTAY